MITIFHNPRCRKSREALAVLNNADQTVDVREYLKFPPSEAELVKLLNLLNKRPLEIIRKNEQLFKSNYKGKDYTDKQWIKILAENPILIERPILIKGTKAAIGRPIENLNNLL